MSRGRFAALNGAAGHPVLAALLDAEPYSTRGMLRFREENALPTELIGLATAARPAEFWRRAELELLRIIERRPEEFSRLVGRIDESEAEFKKLSCEWAPLDPSGPLPVDRRPDGQPIITDALITRWVKASYALKNTGGAYWQAGRMTQQDYADVDRRIQLYFNNLNSGRLAEQFYDAELLAINARLPDVRNVRDGNWSQIRLQ